MSVRWLLLLGSTVLSAAVLCMPVSARATAPEDDLPDGEGKKILSAACTSCHDLTEITKFRGYYVRTQWRDIVVTMVEYGAPVEPPQIEVLTDYLTQHLGKK